MQILCNICGHLSGSKEELLEHWLIHAEENMNKAQNQDDSGGVADVEIKMENIESTDIDAVEPTDKQSEVTETLPDNDSEYTTNAGFASNEKQVIPKEFFYQQPKVTVPPKNEPGQSNSDNVDSYDELRCVWEKQFDRYEDQVSTLTNTGKATLADVDTLMETISDGDQSTNTGKTGHLLLIESGMDISNEKNQTGNHLAQSCANVSQEECNEDIHCVVSEHTQNGHATSDVQINTVHNEKNLSTTGKDNVEVNICPTESNEGGNSKNGNDLKINYEITCENTTARIICLTKMIKTENDNSKKYANTDLKSLDGVNNIEMRKKSKRVRQKKSIQKVKSKELKPKNNKDSSNESEEASTPNLEAFESGKQTETGDRNLKMNSFSEGTVGSNTKKGNDINLVKNKVQHKGHKHDTRRLSSKKDFKKDEEHCYEWVTVKNVTNSEKNHYQLRNQKIELAKHAHQENEKNMNAKTIEKSDGTCNHDNIDAINGNYLDTKNTNHQNEDKGNDDGKHTKSIFSKRSRKKGSVEKDEGKNSAKIKRARKTVARKNLNEDIINDNENPVESKKVFPKISMKEVSTEIQDDVDGKDVKKLVPTKKKRSAAKRREEKRKWYFKKYLSVSPEEQLAFRLNRNAQRQRRIKERILEGTLNTKCHICGITARNIKRHIQNKHTEKGKVELTLACEDCGKMFANRSNMNKHIKSIHLNIRDAACEICGYFFKTKSSLRNHQQSVHTNIKDKKKFPCLVCDKIFFGKRNLEEHKSVHSDDKPYVCTFEGCEKRFRLTSVRRIHEKVHLNIKPWKCDDCGEQFSRKLYLDTHQYKHTGRKMYQCGECGRSFSQKGNLTIHMATKHNKDRTLYSCEHCEKTFSHKTNLTKHRKTQHNLMKLGDNHKEQREIVMTFTIEKKESSNLVN